jgi:lipoyl(octanoyl) transferase
VYIGPRKIAALGLRISRGYSYHGLSFNVGMDLQPFSRINPCGHVGLEVTDLAAEGVNTTTANIEQALLTELQAKLSTGTTFKRAT